MSRPISSTFVTQLTQLHLACPHNPIYIFFQFAIRHNLPLNRLGAVFGISKHTLYIWLRTGHAVRPTLPLEAKLRAAIAQLQALEAAGQLPAEDWEARLRPDPTPAPAVETPAS